MRQNWRFYPPNARTQGQPAASPSVISGETLFVRQASNPEFCYLQIDALSQLFSPLPLTLPYDVPAPPTRSYQFSVSYLNDKKGGLFFVADTSRPTISVTLGL